MAIWYSLGVGQYRASETHILIANKTFKSGNGRTAVLYSPSHGNTAEQGRTPGWFAHVCFALAEAGYPVISCDMGGTTTFGNDAAQTAVGQARTFVGSQFGASITKVVLLGTSMGALLSLNWARNNPTLVACQALALPAADLADLHDNRGYGSEIDAAYGGSSGYTAAKTAHNPAENASSYTSIPTKLWYSNDDTVVPPSIITAFAAGANATTVNLGNVGHNPVSVDAQQVVSFVSQYAS